MRCVWMAQTSIHMEMHVMSRGFDLPLPIHCSISPTAAPPNLSPLPPLPLCHYLCGYLFSVLPLLHAVLQQAMTVR